MLFDSHAHLNRHSFKDDVEGVIDRAREAGVTGIVTIGAGTTAPEFEEAVQVAQGHEGIWAALGVHPHEADQADDATWAALERHLGADKVVALGEVGLDFHYDFSSREGQERVFRRQLALAADRDLPLVLHVREAHEECLAILGESRLPTRAGVVHCYTHDLATARRYVALGFRISIPGVITFRNPGALGDAVAGLAADRLLIETDSPYLAPIPHRGKRNEPAFVRYTAEAVARIKGLTVEDVARVTSLNARRTFGIDAGEAMTPRLAYPIRDSLYVNVTNRCTLHCTFCGKFRDFVVKGHNLRVGRDPSVEDLRAAIEAEGPDRYRELVFCGYGEPLLRPEVVKELAAWAKARGMRTRVNTDGLANRVHGRDVAGELAGLIDAVSVSLNAPDAATYARYCRSPHGEAAFADVCAFLRRAREVIPEVTASVVDLPGLDVEACRRLAEDDLGVRFRLRPYDDLG